MRGFPIARYVAAALFLAGAVEESVRVATRQPWRGYTADASHTVSVFLAVLWAASALLTVRAPRIGARRGTPTVAVVFAGVLAMLTHGIVGRAGGSLVGVAFLVAAPALVILLRLGWKGPVDVGEPTIPQRRPGHDATSVV